MMSRVMTCVLDACCTSICGVSPETVIVSSSAPTFMSALIVTTTSDGTSMAFAHDGAEAGEGERQLVGARPQRVDAIASLVVGDRRANLFDDRGAGGLDRHAGKHAARFVRTWPTICAWAYASVGSNTVAHTTNAPRMTYL